MLRPASFHRGSAMNVIYPYRTMPSHRVLRAVQYGTYSTEVVVRYLPYNGPEVPTSRTPSMYSVLRTPSSDGVARAVGISALVCLNHHSIIPISIVSTRQPMHSRTLRHLPSSHLHIFTSSLLHFFTSSALAPSVLFSSRLLCRSSPRPTRSPGLLFRRPRSRSIAFHRG